MRALILSDIHSNLEALETVIGDAAHWGGFDEIWCLGDTVGYGPDPVSCINLLRGYDLLAVAGNHDHAVVGKRGVDDFNPAARASTQWTASQFTPMDIEFLAGLPLTDKRSSFTLVHGSLRRPIDEYLLDAEAAKATLALLESCFCIVGHSHLPFICRENGSDPWFDRFTEDEVFSLEEERWILNPGSVGQPRDRDPRASYAIYDSDNHTIERHRVGYDIAKTQKKMRDAKLPEYLIGRLNHGV